MELDLALFPPEIRATVYTQLHIASHVDMTHPQHDYLRLIADQPLMCPAEGVAVAFGREHADFVLRNHQLFSSEVMMPLGNVRPLIPLNVDPPKHSKYRRILDPLFTPKRMEAMHDDIAARFNHFMDAFVERGTCNFTDEVADLFPSAVFLGLMGMPWEELDTFLRLRDGILHPEKFVPEPDLLARFQHVNQTGQEIYAYFDAALDERAAHPTDDILTHFTTAEVDGEKMSREEILDLCYLFLIAGLDTVSDSLTCMFAHLATHPEHRRQIVTDPAVIPTAVEELLRWESPVPFGVSRLTTTDVEFPDGCVLAKGTSVAVAYGAANMDPRTFPDGDVVRLDRPENPHLAFGGGVHRCLGSHLARRELRVAITEWHRRIPEYGLTPGHEELVFPPGLRHVKDLMLSWN